MPFELNYDNMIILDAEELAELGLKRAYEELYPNLKQFISRPAAIKEILDIDAPRYEIVYQGKSFVICAPDLTDNEGKSWGIATYVLFHIINDQLKHSDIRFYAIYGGNDLNGIFLTTTQCAEAQQSLSKKEWPYLPTSEDPWYGQPHD